MSKEKSEEEIRAAAEAEVKALEERKAKMRADHFGFIRPMGSDSDE